MHPKEGKKVVNSLVESASMTSLNLEREREREKERHTVYREVGRNRLEIDHLRETLHYITHSAIGASVKIHLG